MPACFSIRILSIILGLILLTAVTPQPPAQAAVLLYTATQTPPTWTYDLRLLHDSVPDAPIWLLQVALPVDSSLLVGASIQGPQGWTGPTGGELAFGPDLEPGSTFILWRSDPSGIYDLLQGGQLAGFLFETSEAIAGFMTFDVNGQSAFEYGIELPPHNADVPETSTWICSLIGLLAALIFRLQRRLRHTSTLVLLLLLAVGGTVRAQTSCTVFGYVMDSTNGKPYTGVAGLSLRITGGSLSKTVTTVASPAGKFSFSGIPLGATYTVTLLSVAGWTIEKGSYTVALTASNCPYGSHNIVGDSFLVRSASASPATDKIQIAAKVVLASSPTSGVLGARVTLTGGGYNTTQTTPSNGQAAFSNLPKGQTYSVSATVDGYTLKQTSFTCNSCATSMAYTFEATPKSNPTVTLSGKVTQSTGSVFGGLKIILSSAAGTQSTTTDPATGNYSFSVVSGATYTIQPEARTGWSYNPTHYQRTPISAISDLNFVASKGNAPPLVSAADMTGPTSLRIAPGRQYTFSAKYHDPDGAADLKALYFRLSNPNEPVTMVYDPVRKALASVTGGAPGSISFDAVTATTLGDGSGYHLVASFTPKKQWPYTTNLSIQVQAEDRSGVFSGWATFSRTYEFRSTLFEDFLASLSSSSGPGFPSAIDRYNRGYKRLLIFQIDIKKIIAQSSTLKWMANKNLGWASLQGNVSLYLDADDLLKLTAEGREGWVTFWLGASLGLQQELDVWRLIEAATKKEMFATVATALIKRPMPGIVDDPNQEVDVVFFDADISNHDYLFGTYTLKGALSWQKTGWLPEWGCPEFR